MNSNTNTQILNEVENKQEGIHDFLIVQDWISHGFGDVFLLLDHLMLYELVKKIIFI